MWNPLMQHYDLTGGQLDGNARGRKLGANCSRNFRNHLTTCSWSLDGSLPVNGLFEAAGCVIHHSRQASSAETGVRGVTGNCCWTVVVMIILNED